LSCISCGISSIRNASIWDCGLPLMMLSVPQQTLSSPRYFISLPKKCAACVGSPLRLLKDVPTSPNTLPPGPIPAS
jgi:hypothetical protein